QDYNCQHLTGLCPERSAVCPAPGRRAVLIFTLEVMRMKKLLALLTAMAMCFTLLTACGGGGQTNTESPDAGGTTETGTTETGTTGEAGGTFTVGVIGPLTGGAAIYGTAVANAAQIAVEEINALGGDIQFELLTQ